MIEKEKERKLRIENEKQKVEKRRRLLDERNEATEKEKYQLEEMIDYLEKDLQQLEQEKSQLNGQGSSECPFYPSSVKHAEQQTDINGTTV